MKNMRVRMLSLWQPWASFIVNGQKWVETRGYNTSYRGIFLIHATKNIQPLKTVAEKPYFKSCIEEMGGIDKLPFGQIIGATVLICAMRTEEIITQVESGRQIESPFLSKLPISNWEKEFTFGNYQAERYGWLLKNSTFFKKPIPATGLQNFGSISITPIIDKALQGIRNSIGAKYLNDLY